jgi:hypothetical protein
MNSSTRTSTFDFDALSLAWQDFAKAAGIPAEYCGDSTEVAHTGAERAQALLRQHIGETGDYRLFSLLHLLGNASVRMEQVIDPDGYAETTAHIEAALAKAELDPRQAISPADAQERLKKSLLRRD